MKRFFAAIIVMAISCASFAQTKIEKIDELVKKYSDSKLFNGTVLVADESGIIFKKGYGFANMEWKIPNEPDTKFRLGSITKQFTALVILQLAQEGKIKLDGKITDYLDYYRKDVGDKVTIHHLLTHSSGIPSYTGKPDFREKASRRHFTPDDLVKELCSDDFEFQPGAQFSYNNSGYVILGAIIEKLTGKSYADVLQERIFKPLQMTSTGYDDTESLLEKRAAGYESGFAKFTNASFLDMSIPYSAGSLYSTVEDLYKWDRALYTNQLLNKEFMKEYFAPRIEAFGGHYAYGWFVNKNKSLVDGKELDIITHGGGINGFNTVITRVTNDKKLVVLLNNTGETILDEIYNSILNVLYNKEPLAMKKPISKHLGDIIANKGIDEAVKEYKRIQSTEGYKYRMREAELNNLGYYYLNNKQYDEAIAVFKLNMEAYPNSSNTYDSYAEALMNKGDKEGAITYYKKAYELNPRVQGTVNMLKKLGVEVEVAKDAVVDAKVLKTYEGKYELNSNFFFTVTTEENRLFIQATGQPRAELFPATETKFYAKVVDAQIVFNKSDKGEVTGLYLIQNGREMLARRVE